ncbi:hypothetical protein [Rubrobacter radiotolerans]|uniref:Uncharacterized protein n=1 Tax=Rubrobacter radiotolerans TaxID=42256 RepID=A0AB35T2G6_RUBRA|nr:hypothetical protein [Rubrobacter radiotolerans]MDX5892970.1 hypothetical protein [Rubrobacter radiotolerans]
MVSKATGKQAHDAPPVGKDYEKTPKDVRKCNGPGAQVVEGIAVGAVKKRAKEVRER